MKEIWKYFIENLDTYFPLIISLVSAFLGYIVGALSKTREKYAKFNMERFEELFKPFFLIVNKYNRKDGAVKWENYGINDANEILNLLAEKWIYQDILMRSIVDRIFILENDIANKKYEIEDDKKNDILERSESFDLLCKIFGDEWNKIQLKMMWTKGQRIKNWFVRKYRINKYKIPLE